MTISLEVIETENNHHNNVTDKLLKWINRTDNFSLGLSHIYTFPNYMYLFNYKKQQHNRSEQYVHEGNCWLSTGHVSKTFSGTAAPARHVIKTAEVTGHLILNVSTYQKSFLPMQCFLYSLHDNKTTDTSRAAGPVLHGHHDWVNQPATTWSLY